MARTVANKRGSARGAPPDVYLAFGDFGEEDEEVWKESFKLCKTVFGMIVFGILAVFIYAIFWAIIPKYD